MSAEYQANAPNQMESDHEEEKGPHLIESLESQNIPVHLISQCKRAGHPTVESVAFTTQQEIMQIKGVSESTAQRIHMAAMKMSSKKIQFCSATEVYQERVDLTRISTGSSRFDELLGGGIESGCIYELFGESGTGKTQICHQLCVTAQFPKESGGGEGRVLYIDTCGTFRPKRVVQMAERYGMDTNDTLDNVSFARAYSTDDQMKLLDEASTTMAEAKFALIIVDSVSALFRSELSARPYQKYRDVLLCQFLAKLKKLCAIYNVAAVITNEWQRDYDGASFPFLYRAFGGEVIQHGVTHRIGLRKVNKNKRIAKVCKSCDLPSEEMSFAISVDGSGIVDCD